MSVACAECGTVSSKPLARRGLCRTCYMRHYRAGTLPPLEPKSRRPEAERFWEKVNKDGPTMPHMATPCWVWTANSGPLGYGRFGGEVASRVAYRLAHGTHPGELDVCHHCDNPPCVNPEHLFLGTAKDNAQDMARKGRNKGFLTDKRPRPCPGERNGSARLTADDVIAIRSSTAPRKELAAAYGVAQSTISAIVTRRLWKHLP